MDRHGKAEGHYYQKLIIIAGCKKPLQVVRVSAVAHHIGTVEGAGGAAWTAGSGMCHPLVHKLIAH
jgi:hypothetical protein